MSFVKKKIINKRVYIFTFILSAQSRRRPQKFKDMTVLVNENSSII